MVMDKHFISKLSMQFVIGLSPCLDKKKQIVRQFFLGGGGGGGGGHLETN